MWHPHLLSQTSSVLEPPVPVVHTAPAPVIEYVAPAPDVTLATPAPVIEYTAPAHTVDVAPAPSSSWAAPASVIEHVAPATPVTMNAHVAPAPVIEYIAPPTAVFYPLFSQQLTPADTNEATAVEASAPHDGGSLLPLDKQIVDIPTPRDVEEIGDVSVQLGTHAINDCVQSLKTQQRKGGQTRGGDLESSLEVTGVDQVAWAPTRNTPK